MDDKIKKLKELKVKNAYEECYHFFEDHINLSECRPEELKDIYYILSNICFHLGKDGLLFCDALMHLPTKVTGKELQKQTHLNSLFYIKKIKLDKKIRLKSPIPGYFPSNCSIIKTKAGFELILRCINYYVVFPRMIITSNDNKARTINLYLTMNKNYEIIDKIEIKDNFERPRFPSNSLGLEDCRLFKWQDKTFFICDSYDINKNNRAQIVLCELNEEHQINKLTPIIGPIKNRPEKNWLPITDQKELKFLYSSNPPTFAEIKNNKAVITEGPKINKNFEEFRGSATFIPFEDGYLYTVHEAVLLTKCRQYTNRFVYTDKNFNIVKISLPFLFSDGKIEFSAGMCWDHSKENIVLTFSVLDFKSFIGIISKDRVKKMLYLI